MAWEGLSVFVAAMALLLSLYNTREIRRAPELARQQALWDELRTLVEATFRLVDDARVALGVGGELPHCPPDLGYAQKRLGEIAPRFANDANHVHARLASLQAELSQLETGWRMALHHEEQLAFFTEQVDLAAAHGQSDDAKRFAALRDQHARRREASHREMDKYISAVRSSLKLWKGLLDKRDRGERTSPGWNETGPAIYRP